MSREVRMVPPDWEHPKDENGDDIPLFDGSRYESELADWLEQKAQWDRGYVKDYSKDAEPWVTKEEGNVGSDTFEEWHGYKPQQKDYMPTFPPGTATHLCMYESTTEGTPISPAFATPEELARWLTDNRASAFGGMTATYDQWLATCKAGWSPGMVIERYSDGTGIMKSGVEIMAEKDTKP